MANVTSHIRNGFAAVYAVYIEVYDNIFQPSVHTENYVL